MERGYTVFERAYDEEDVCFLRDLLIREWKRIGSPALESNPPSRPAPDVEVGPAGLIFHRLSSQFPEVIPRLYKGHIIETIRLLLGDGMRLELPAGVLSDEHRPFFDWHTHIDGVDDAFYNNQRPFDEFRRSMRVTHLLYLDDMDDRSGQLLVFPRKITDPTPPPFECTNPDWEGLEAIECPRGSVVVLEQCTWHAARQRTTSGIRSFVGSYFAARDAPPTPLSDPELASYRGDDELFRSIMPKDEHA